MESGSWREGESLVQPRVDLERDESVGGLGDECVEVECCVGRGNGKLFKG